MSSARRYQTLREHGLHARCTKCGGQAHDERHHDERVAICGDGHVTEIHAAENAALLVDWVMGLPGYTLNICRESVSVVYLDGGGEPEAVAKIDPDKMRARMADHETVRHFNVACGLIDRHYHIIDWEEQ